jgi:hypothetical protein
VLCAPQPRRPPCARRKAGRWEPSIRVSCSLVSPSGGDSPSLSPSPSSRRRRVARERHCRRARANNRPHAAPNCGPCSPRRVRAVPFARHSADPMPQRIRRGPGVKIKIEPGPSLQNICRNRHLPGDSRWTLPKSCLADVGSDTCNKLQPPSRRRGATTGHDHACTRGDDCSLSSAQVRQQLPDHFAPQSLPPSPSLLLARRAGPNSLRNSESEFDPLPVYGT